MSKITSFLAVFLLLFRAKQPVESQTKIGKVFDEFSNVSDILKAATPAAASPKAQKIERGLMIASAIRAAVKDLRK